MKIGQFQEILHKGDIHKMVPTKEGTIIMIVKELIKGALRLQRLFVVIGKLKIRSK